MWGKPNSTKGKSCTVTVIHCETKEREQSFLYWVKGISILIFAGCSTIRQWVKLKISIQV